LNKVNTGYYTLAIEGLKWEIETEDEIKLEGTTLSITTVSLADTTIKVKLVKLPYPEERVGSAERWGALLYVGDVGI
jgi:hypothetical protein